MEAGMGVQCVLEYLFPTVIGDLLNKMSPALIKTSPSYFVQRNSQFVLHFRARSSDQTCFPFKQLSDVSYDNVIHKGTN